jgi:hypothetical protein
VAGDLKNGKQRDHKLHPSVYLRAFCSQSILSSGTRGTGDITKVHASITKQQVGSKNFTRQSTNLACAKPQVQITRRVKIHCKSKNQRVAPTAELIETPIVVERNESYAAGEIFCTRLDFSTSPLSLSFSSPQRFLCMHNEWVFFSQAHAVCSMAFGARILLFRVISCSILRRVCNL